MTDASVHSSATQAERIRGFVRDRYIIPARQSGLAEIVLRAGDVHREMGLSNAMPAVCSAIGSHRFEQFAAVTPVGRTGPASGSNVYFRFRLDLDESTLVAKPKKLEPRGQSLGSTIENTQVDLTGALVLISCVKSKLSHSAPARLLYTSTWFTGARDFAEAKGARWFLLSSQYGLVAPNTVIAPYDYTLKSLGVRERQRWAADVLNKLLPEVVNFRRVVMFAGSRYREFLILPLERRGITVEVPLEHLRIGEQLAWLTQHR